MGARELISNRHNACSPMINSPLQDKLQLPSITPPENRAGNVLSDTEHPIFLGDVFLTDATHVKSTVQILTFYGNKNTREMESYQQMQHESEVPEMRALCPKSG